MVLYHGTIETSFENTGHRVLKFFAQLKKKNAYPGQYANGATTVTHSLLFFVYFVYKIWNFENFSLLWIMVWLLWISGIEFLPLCLFFFNLKITGCTYQLNILWKFKEVHESWPSFVFVISLVRVVSFEMRFEKKN